MIGRSWRPEGGKWKNPYILPQYIGEVESLDVKYKIYEAGASAIIPAVEAEVLKKVGEWLGKKAFAVPLSGVHCGIRFDHIKILLQGEMPEEE